MPREAAPVALDREPAAVYACAARVGNEAVPLDHDWILGLGDLDRDVRGHAGRVVSPSLPSASGRAAPGAEAELDSRCTGRPPAGRAEDYQRVAALAGGDTRSRQQAGERLDDGVDTRKPVTPRIEEAPGIWTLIDRPGVETTRIGRKTPAVLGHLDRPAPRSTAW